MSRCRGLEKNVREHTAAAGLSLGHRAKSNEGDQGSQRNKDLVQTNIGMDGWKDGGMDGWQCKKAALRRGY